MVTMTDLVRRARLVVAISLAVACGGDTTAPTITMAGNWSGTVSPQSHIALSLAESGGTVTGSGAIDNTPVTVHGTHSPSTASVLDLMTTGGATITLNVEVLQPKNMSGHLYGGAYDTQVAILTRQ